MLADSLADSLAEGDGLADALADPLAEGEMLALPLADSLADGDGLADPLTDSLAEGDRLALPLTEIISPPQALTDIPTRRMLQRASADQGKLSTSSSASMLNVEPPLSTESARPCATRSMKSQAYHIARESQ